MKILDGKTMAQSIINKMKHSIKLLPLSLSLSVILVGDNSSSKVYVNQKKKVCEDSGIKCDIFNFPSFVAEEDLVEIINTLNNDSSVTGILVQLPLPDHINPRVVLDSVNINKDVDGLTSYHLMKILLNEECIIPCTPKGILELLDNYNISLEGKKVCIIGFSYLVGKPLATLCINRHATVTVCHNHTNNLKEHTLSSEIIMTATGVPNLITSSMVKKGAIVVDIGITVINNKIVGDVDFENVAHKCSYITPVPGGVGPMTVAMVLRNLYECYKLQTAI